jgi:uncharacterized protein YqgV (UPF0045/DUF77 family)
VELRIEFTVEPFLEGHPGPHVGAAIDEARRRGLDPEMGPFATTIDGPSDRVLAGLAAIIEAAVSAGATRVAFTVSRREVAPVHPFLEAIDPLARALDARVVPTGDMTPGDIPLAFEGEILAGMRLPAVRGMLDRMIGDVERQLGGKLSHLSREDKQQAVKLLDERGAFNLRRSIDEVADALGVSRITVYNYLNRRD